MSRQNQCHECHGWGHNRRGCPRIKESHAKVEAMAKKYGIPLPAKDEYVSTQWISDINAANMAANGNVTDSNDEITYSERWNWEEIEGRKRAQSRKNGRGRTCGFRGEGGHNSRTCPDKKQHRKNCDAMQGLAHRVVATCLEKAGIVPGALMYYRDWSYETRDYTQSFALVLGVDWSKIASPGHDSSQGLPRGFEEWFRGSFIKARMSDGSMKYFRIPSDVRQQSKRNYSETRDAYEGLTNPVRGGKLNKDNGWMGENVTLIDPACHGIYRWSKEGIVDEELQPVIEKLISDAGSKWSDV